LFKEGDNVNYILQKQLNLLKIFYIIVFTSEDATQTDLVDEQHYYSRVEAIRQMVT